MLDVRSDSTHGGGRTHDTPSSSLLMSVESPPMLPPVGFDRHIAIARDHNVVLLVGPRGIGKRTTCAYLAKTSGATPAEQVIVSRLDMDAARWVIERCRTVPVRGRRAFAINIEAVSTHATNALLKTLEEGADSTSFYLHSSAPVPPTITSRAITLHHGVLTDDQVYQVCRAHGMDDEAAYVAARAAKGIPAVAMKVLERYNNRHVVSTLMRAVAQGDQDLLSVTTAAMDHDQLDLLRTWAHEAYTKQWSLFAPGETYGMEDDPSFVRRVHTYTQRSGSPRLVARAALWLPTEQRSGRVA